MDLGDKKFSNMSEGKGRKTKWMARFGITFGCLGIFLSSLLAVIWQVFSVLYLFPWLFGIVAIFFGLTSLSKELSICEEGMKIPKTIWRRECNYEEIEYIDLNTKKTEPHSYVTFKFKDGEEIDYPKHGLQDWKQFYKIAGYFLSKKVKVRGME